MNFTSVFTKNEKPILIAGPCAAETEAQVLQTAEQIAAAGKIDAFRAGIWKPRTRPGSFEGVGTVGLKWLQKVKADFGFPITTEVANATQVKEALDAGVDILWIGARTTVNPFSIQEVADALEGLDVPVMIKNPINADLELWIGGIERLHNAGITRLAAIHRGFSTHRKTQYRNQPMWEIPIELMRRIPNLQMINDPSHICGNRTLLAKVAQKAMDLNFDGLMIETHPTPDEAWSDAAQQIVPMQLMALVQQLVIRNKNVADDSNRLYLEQLRRQIDDIDHELLHLISNRMKVAEKIGKVKKEHNIAVFQLERWAEILHQAIQNGQQLGLSEDFVETLLNAIHKESINHQIQIMNKM